MDTKDHVYYLSQSFQLRCSDEIFSDEDVEVLNKYGAWLEALSTGQLSPSTDKQQRFVRAVRGEVEAETAWEKLWIKYTKRLKWELDNPNVENKMVLNDPGEAWFPRGAARMGGLSKFFSK